jgi:hypothetical protein
MPDTRTVKKIFKWNPLTKRSQGRPKYRWEDNISQYTGQMRVKNCSVCLQDRGNWKKGLPFKEVQRLKKKKNKKKKKKKKKKRRRKRQRKKKKSRRRRKVEEEED